MSERDSHEVDYDGDNEGSQQEEQPTITVEQQVYERFEERRKETKTDSVPELDQSTFLSSLLDTEKAAREGYYDDE